MEFRKIAYKFVLTYEKFLLLYCFLSVLVVNVSFCCYSAECPSELQLSTSEYYQNIEAICVIDLHICEIPVILPKCFDLTVPIKSLHFSIKSIRSFYAETNFIQILWDIPLGNHSLFSKTRSPLSVGLKLTVDNDTCITMTFSLEALDLQKGQFLIPCVKINNSTNHLLHYTSYIIYQDSVQLLHSQELAIVIPKGESSVSPPTTSDLSVAVTDKFLVVSFVPGYAINSSYEISLHDVDQGKCNFAASLETWNTAGRRRLLKSNLDKYKSCNTYCLQAASMHRSSSCERGCVTHLVVTSYFHSPAKLKFCDAWNATLVGTDDSKRREITINFHKCCGYEHCFRSFDLYLALLRHDNCNEYYSDSLSSSTITNEYPDEYVWRKENLPPGNYCAKVKPAFCPGCKTLNSNIINIRKVSSDPFIPLFEDKSTTVQKNAVIGCSIAASFILISSFLLGFIYWKKKRKLILPAAQPQRDAESLLEDHKSSEINAFILHTYKPAVKQKVSSLVDYIRQRNKVTVELSTESRPQIETVGGEQWINLRTQFGTKVVLPNKDDATQLKFQKVIIVEDERAVAYQHLLDNMSVADLPNENFPGDPSNDMQGIDWLDRPLDKLFPYALKKILSRDDALNDYLHILVVHFTDITPKECRLRGLPDLRYYLPDDLEDLCTSLEADTKYGPPQ